MYLTKYGGAHLTLTPVNTFSPVKKIKDLYMVSTKLNQYII